MPIARILVATDFSEASHDALRYAEMLATHFTSELHILHVVPDARGESWASEAAGLDLEDLTEDWISIGFAHEWAPQPSAVRCTLDFF